MPAYFEEGFMVREPAWHGLGIVLDEYPGREEAMRLAGHDFKVMGTPIYGIPTGVIDTHKALYRSDTQEVIGVVRRTYTVVQNETMWDVVDALVNEPNVKYETAGVLKGGSTLWVLAKLDEPVTISGDNSPILPYVLVSTTHDGTASLKASAGSVRVVCANTYQAAGEEAKRNGTDFSFRHTRNVGDRIEEARLALGLVRANHSRFVEILEDLAHINVSRDGVTEFIETLIPEPRIAAVSDRVKNNIAEARQLVRETLAGVTVPDAHKRTAYGLYCAGVEYADHLRVSHSPETYFKRNMMTGAALKDRIAKLAVSVS